MSRCSAGEIGRVDLFPDSEVLASGGPKRWSLKRGQLHAFIWAPPREFVVDTPSRPRGGPGVRIHDQGG